MKLTSAQRRMLPDSAFVFPKTRKYPIPDRQHAIDALARVAANGTDYQKKVVREEVHRRFPSLRKKVESM